MEKIKSEYRLYYFLPENLQRWFVQPYNLITDNNIASYEMEKIHSKNVGEMLVNGEVDLISFKKMFNMIINFKRECKDSYYSEDNCKEESEYLVITKTKNRIGDEHPDIFERIFKAYNFYKKERISWMKTVSHGDLCLSNIIWINDFNIIKLIDPRGASIKKEIYMDEYYDLAKLSHSILGGYENILYRKTYKDEAIQNIFIEYLNKNNISINLLRVYEASLFLSMIPLHSDSPHNVEMFLNKSKEILLELGF